MFDKEEHIMFTVGAFSIFFWTLAGVIALMLIFEDKLIALEDEYDRRKAEKKRAKLAQQRKASVRTAQVKRVTDSRINNQKREISRKYAA